MGASTRGTDPMVTVIVPMYNQERNLRGLVEGLRRQTVPDAEFMLVDDGSTDRTLSLARALVTRDPRFVVLAKENSGAGTTRNYAMRRARGRYLFFLDADDRIAEDTTLEELCTIADQEHVPICGGSIRFAKRGKLQASPQCVWTPERDAFQYFLGTKRLQDEPYEYFGQSGVYDYSQYQYDAGFTRFIYSRELLLDNEVLFPKRRYLEDPAFFVRAFDAAGHFGAIERPSYIYNVGWHPLVHDERYFLETLEGIRQNLVFSRERGYRRLHRITCNRFRQCDDVDLVIGDKNVGELSGAVHATWEAFDPDFAEGGHDVALPQCVIAVDSYGSASWNSASARLNRVRRKARAEAVRLAKGSRLTRVAEAASGRRCG